MAAPRSLNDAQQGDYMRLLHTADWHIGQTIQGYDRSAEHRAAFAALIAIVKDRTPDALVVAGDVFDHQNPSGDAFKLFYETLIALKAAHSSMCIVISAGNHDAAGRLEAPAPLLDALGVHVIGNVRRAHGVVEAARHLVTVNGDSGRVLGEIVAVSYPTATCLPPFGSLEREDGRSPIIEGTRALYADIIERSGAGRRGLPLVLTGHLHVAGGLESEGAERRILVGGQHAVPAGIFPPHASYVALGHLHRAQTFDVSKTGGPLVRYAGSLFPLSASEIGYDHGVTLVTLEEASATAEHIPIPRPVPFLRLPREGALAFAELEAAVTAAGRGGDAAITERPFAQVMLERDGLPPDYRSRVDELAEKHGVRVVEVRIPSPALACDIEIASPGARLAELNPADLFVKAFERRHGKPPLEQHIRAFHTALARAEAED